MFYFLSSLLLAKNGLEGRITGVVIVVMCNQISQHDRILLLSIRKIREMCIAECM